MVGVHTVVCRATPGGTATDLSCLVDVVSLAGGRDDPETQPDAATAQVEFTATPDDPLPPVVEIGAIIEVATTHGSTAYRRFTGRVTDVVLGWDDAGEQTPEAGVGQILAAGVLADVGRRVIGDTPWPAELDGARVSRVMAAAGIVLDPAYSDPGTVTVLPRDVDSKPALEVARSTAESASGMVWETRAGDVRYADAKHRAGAPVVLELDACDILVTPTWRRTTEGLLNKVSVEYGTAPDGSNRPTYVNTNAASVTKYGRYEAAVATELANLADAQALGDMLLARNAAPVWVMGALPIDVDSLTADQYAALLTLQMHDLVRVTGLPVLGTAPTSATLWVEGYSETLAYGIHEVELVVSGYCRTSPAPWWNVVDPYWTWNTMPADLTWDTADCLGPPASYGRWDDTPATTRWNLVPAATTWDTWEG